MNLSFGEPLRWYRNRPLALSRAMLRMEKYQNVPMDLADATLVSLAEETGVGEVFTLDRRGFHAYGIGGKKAFRIWPE